MTIADLRSRLHQLETEVASLRDQLDATAATAPSRRHLLRAAAAGAVGTAAGALALARPSAAATGGNFVLGQANTADAVTSLQNNGPFTDLNGPGPVALELRSPGGHLRFVGAPGDTVLGTYSDGTVTYNSSMGVHLWFDDVVTHVAGRGSTSVNPLPIPVRVHDSRNQQGPVAGGRLASGDHRAVPLHWTNEGEAAEVLSYGSRGAVINVTAVDTLGTGFLTVGPPAATRPPTSNLNWTGPGQIVANMAMTRLDEATLYVWAGGGGSTHVVVDVMAILG